MVHAYVERQQHCSKIFVHGRRHLYLRKRRNMQSASFCKNIGVAQMQVYNLFLSVDGKNDLISFTKKCPMACSVRSKLRGLEEIKSINNQN